MNTQRSSTITRWGLCQTIIKLPSYLLLCPHTAYESYLFHLRSRFSGFYTLQIKGYTLNISAQQNAIAQPEQG